MRLLSLLISFVFILVIQSQVFTQVSKDTRPGEVLVQLHNKEDLNRLISDYHAFGLKHLTTVSQRFNIYLLHFDDNRTTADALIRSMQSESVIANIQENHKLSLREINDTTPDDPFLSLQWALDNYGQNGGSEDADIDAPEAWTYGTGGVTAHGDTIVIAIVDGGSDINHEDLDFWKNTAEIPDNNIDDDTNGYIDDYDGWNAYIHSGYIPANAHGVHVAGIAGAKGNNGKGISGVNWNVKILPIAGESTNEATVVEALSYIYVLRERYDETGGAEGAFVVADNCSFGKDKGDPAEYPIWEAMYDSLGKLGILSVGATANANWDVDIEGDVPTAFETDYMISVTNTTNKDLKYNSAAYGDTTIDLGAPGTIIQSLLPLDKYGTKTGTSMAAPHVTGAIALMFSLADSVFIAQYKSNPGVYVLQVKEHLLAGVDTLEDLMGKTVTGGRLNLHKAIQSFLDQPFMTFAPDSLYAGLLMDDIALDTLFITNSGSDTLVYELMVPENIAWLTVSEYNGSLTSGQTDTVVVVFNSAGLDTGTYQTEIYIEQVGQEPTEIQALMEVFDDVGIQLANTEDPTIQVYPNPFDEQLNFSIKGHSPETLEIEVYGYAGNSVFKRSIIQSGGTARISWYAGQLPVGMYYYRIRQGKMILEQGKLVKL